MTLREAVKRGISTVRDPHWACKEDHIKIDLIESGHGPWVHLYSQSNEVVGNPNPVTMLCTTLNWDEDGWEEYRKIAP